MPAFDPLCPRALRPCFPAFTAGPCRENTFFPCYLQLSSLDLPVLLLLLLLLLGPERRKRRSCCQEWHLYCSCQCLGVLFSPPCPSSSLLPRPFPPKSPFAPTPCRTLPTSTDAPPLIPFCIPLVSLMPRILFLIVAQVLQHQGVCWCTGSSGARRP